jgi:hypothetical protein
MIDIYCADHHQRADGLCGECENLLDYAKRRLDGCPFQEAKPVCSRCLVFCFSPKLRARVQAVMRYSGPRMLFSHPFLGLRHLVDKLGKIPTLPRARGR